MGLFDRLSGNNFDDLTPRAALALAVMIVISADGAIENEEIDNLKRVIQGDNNAFDLAYKVFKAKSMSDCIGIVSQALDQKQRIATIANILDVAMADGVLADAEQQVLEVFVEQFGIRDDILQSIVDVIAVKNDYSVF